MFLEPPQPRVRYPLLTRDAFRNAVLGRDRRCCVVCGSAAQDARHILERRLWPDGGYYLDNGASLCGDHHMQAEQTTLSCQVLREAIGIGPPLLPPHLYRDQDYDKWGNPIMPNGTRLKGDLFHDESAQKALASVLSLFTDHVKYPRTYHLPTSPGCTSDDRMMPDDSVFEAKNVIVTLKMDGENTTMYRDYVHARSLVFEPHPSRNWVKVIHSKIAHEIPVGWRICGENLTAVHSIEYKALPGYFQMFSIWNEKNVCLSWTETVEWAELLELPLVPVLLNGVYDSVSIADCFRYFQKDHEGFVVRLAESFPYSAFRHSVGKYVRRGHVQTHGHWMREQVRFNGLKT